MDRDDLMQAIEIALGDRLKVGESGPRTVAQRDVDQWAVRLRRVMAELDPGTTVHEIIEALDE